MESLQTTTENEFMVVELLDFQCNNAFYNIKEGYNSFRIVTALYDVSTGITFYYPTVITITPGYYGVSDLITQLNTKIYSTYSISYNNGANSASFRVGFQSISFNSTTGKLEWTPVNANNYKTLNAEGDLVRQYVGTYVLYDSNIRLLRILGFNTTNYSSIGTNVITNENYYGWGSTYTYNSSSSTYTYSTYAPPYSLDLSYPNSIYVIIDEISTDFRNSIRNFTFSNTIARIPVTGYFGDILEYTPAVPSKAYCGDLLITNITVRLIDEFGESLDFQGTQWTMSLHIYSTLDLHGAGLQDSTLGRTYMYPRLGQRKTDELEVARPSKRVR